MWKPPYVWSKSQRRGVLLLGILSVVMQLVIVLWPRNHSVFWDQKAMQAWEEKLQKNLKIKQDSTGTQFQYNPNFLTDYRSYQLGIPTLAYDRLMAFRKSGRYIKNHLHFQKVTGVSDTTLTRLEKHLRYPNFSELKNRPQPAKNAWIKKGLNTASPNELTAINGIGTVRANRIIKYKKYLGGYTSLDQLDEVYGLPDEVLLALKQKFDILQKPKINRRSFQTISLDSLVKLPYINRDQARMLLKLRTQHPNLPLDSLWQYSGLKGIAVQRIKLYLY